MSMHAGAEARKGPASRPPLVLFRGSGASGPEFPKSPAIDFNALAKSHSGALLSHATRLTRERCDAWDLVQDTFERVLSRPPQLHEPVKLRGWMFVVMHNLYRDRCRTEARRKRVALTDDALTCLPEPERPASPAWRSIELADVRDCLQRLDPLLREPYELKVEQGLSLAQIAARLGIPSSTVGTRIHRARRKLKQLLTAAAAAA